MMRQYSASLFLLLLTSLFIFSSCSSSKVDVDSDVGKVRKVGLVSVSANRGIRKMGLIPSVTEVASKLSSVGEDQLDKENQDEKISAMLNHAATSLSHKLNQSMGWHFTPVDELVSNEAYKKFIEKVKTITDAAAFSSVTKLGYASVKGMERIPVEEEGVDKRFKEELETLAKQLGLDAVMVVNLDIAYTSGTSLMGYGTAVASVGLGCSLIAKNGDELITTGEAEEDETFRAESEKSVAMIMGEIAFFDDDVQKMIQDSITKGINKFSDKIVAEK